MTQALSQQIHSRYSQVQETIAKTTKAIGRSPNSVRLIVVTKTHPLDTLLSALEAGICEFGENYAEEAVEKIKAVGPREGLTWHMIGHVQSRKAELVSNYFDYVHSIDSYKLAVRIDRFAEACGRSLSVLLECNVSGEESKFGYPVFDRSQWNSFYQEAEKIAGLSHLQIRGLMTMPPLFDDPGKTRPFFRNLRELRDSLRVHLADINWEELSMGTSADFPTALEEGATIIRIGTAILGARPAKP
jgi:PLP dependent protein